LHVALWHCASSATFLVELWHCVSSCNIVALHDVQGIVHCAMALCIVPLYCIALEQCALSQNNVHCPRMMHIVLGQCIRPWHDAHCLVVLQGFAHQKGGLSQGVMHRKRGVVHQKKGHHTSCTVLAFTSCHGISRWQSAQQLCGRKKTKLKCRKLHQQVVWGGLKKNTIHLCSVSSGGGNNFTSAVAMALLAVICTTLWPKKYVTSKTNMKTTINL